MNSKTIGLVLGGLALLVAAFFSGDQSGKLGATINYYSSLNQSRLYDVNASLLGDIVAVRAPLANVSSTSVTIDFPSVATSSAPMSATTTAFAGAALGDFVLVAPSTSTQWITYTVNVQAANTVEIVAHNASTSAINPDSSIFYLRLLPQGSFARPATIVTTTSTSN